MVWNFIVHKNTLLEYVTLICCLSGTYDYITFKFQDFIGNSLYCLPYNLCDVWLENLELDQPIIP